MTVASRLTDLPAARPTPPPGTTDPPTGPAAPPAPTPPSATTPPQHHVAPHPPLPTTGQPFRFNRHQYYQLDRLGYFHGKRVERIHGVILEMSPIGWNHALACGLLADWLRGAFAGVAWVSEGNPLPTNDSDPQPDIMVIPGQRRDYTDHPTTAWLVVEVADSTLDYDLTTKAELYATANIPEYWVLDLTTRQLHQLREPIPVPGGRQAYRHHLILTAADTVTPLAAPHASFALAEMLP